MQQAPTPTAAAGAAAPQEANVEEAWGAFRAGVTSVFKQVGPVCGGCAMGWLMMVVGGSRCYHIPYHH